MSTGVPMGGGVITGRDGLGNPIVTYYAPVSPPVNEFDALAYYSDLDGQAADPMIQRAINAAQAAGGGRVKLPGATLVLNNPLTISADNIEMQGAGWSTILTPGASFPGGYLLTVQAPGGGAFRYGIRLADFYLNCNNVAGVSGIDMQTTYHARLDHLRIRYCTGTAIYMDGSSGNTGAYNLINGCTITDGGAGIGIATNFSEWLTVIGGTISFYNQPGGVAIKCGNLNCRFIGVAIDNNDTGFWQSFAGRATIAGCQFDRGQKRFIYLQGSQYSTIIGNSFNTYNGTSGTGCIDVTDANNAGNVIVANTLRGGSGWTNFIFEHATVGTPTNTYAENDTGGSAIVLVNGTARGNRGVNPVGKLTAQPAVPASGTAYTNVTGYDCTVYLTGGTFTASHQIGGQSIGNSTATVLRIAAGQSVTLTYSAAPTWLWIGD